MDGDDGATLGMDVAKAIRIATSGRPGPVHLSLPSDLLDARLRRRGSVARGHDSPRAGVTLTDSAADAILALLAGAQRPLLLAGSGARETSGRDLLARIEARNECRPASWKARVASTMRRSVPSPRVRRADLIVLLGKALDFTLRFGAAPAVDPACRFVAVIPRRRWSIVPCAKRVRASRSAAWPTRTGRRGADPARGRAAVGATSGWPRCERCFADRPASWEALASRTPGKLHPIEVFRR